MYRLEIRTCGNPDYGQNPKKAVAPARTVVGETIEEMMEAMRQYINEWYIGAGNLLRSDLYKDDAKVGVISYNGKVWFD